MGMRDAVHRVRYYTLSCSDCEDFIEAFPPETPQDAVGTARQCGWKFIKGRVVCNKCQVKTPHPDNGRETQDGVAPFPE